MDHEVRDRLAKWLAYFKVRKGFGTNESLADYLGISEPMVTNILNGRRTVGLDVLMKMHRRFSIETDRLLDDNPPANPSPESPNGRDEEPTVNPQRPPETSQSPGVTLKAYRPRGPR